ncbi:hypothetical protein BD779DRAFT_1511049 [Infundibulicybe gibba]|nr:hypothetical protein BD779DRAFT_1511049 [Infundibulicybe gibba]
MTSPFTTNPTPKIPPRPPASTTLWAHLFRTGTEGIVSDETALGRVVPPLTPLDKTGTSMRILLHDTQARFEQFSTRIDTLLVGVRDAHAGIVRVQEMFERGHEDLGEDITSLINRSQTLVQKSIGNPAQGEELDQLRKDVGYKLEALDKRLDAMHLCNQSHAQTLQIQSRALQTLQEQQGTILAAVMPILPLVQALPLYVDAAKTFIVEACKGSCGGTSIPSMSEKGIAASPSSRKRSNSTISDGPPPSPYNAKRQRRLDAFRTGSGSLRKPVVQLNSLGVHVDELGPSPRQTTLSSLATHPPRRRSTIVTQTTKTPRKSLVELSPALLGNTPLDEKDSQEAPVLHAALGVGGGELTKERTVSSERPEGQQGARPREKQVQSMTGNIVPSSVHPQVPPVASCSTTHPGRG